MESMRTVPPAKATSEKTAPANLAGTVARTVQLLRYMSIEGTASIKDIVAELGLAPSTVHRLLELLGSQGMIERDAKLHRYHIGREFYCIAARVTSKNDLQTTVMPLLEEIVAQCDETAGFTLYLPEYRKVALAVRCDSKRPLRYTLPLNQHFPVAWGSSGRAILAYLPEDEIDRIVASDPGSPSTGKRLPSPATLKRELARIRETGYAISQGQKFSGAVGINAPVFNAQGNVIGSIGITVPETHFDPAGEKDLSDLVMEKAQLMSAMQGNEQHLPRRTKVRS